MIGENLLSFFAPDVGTGTHRDKSPVPRTLSPGQKSLQRVRLPIKSWFQRVEDYIGGLD
jgi:hypothetical protein